MPADKKDEEREKMVVTSSDDTSKPSELNLFENNVKEIIFSWHNICCLIEKEKSQRNSAGAQTPAVVENYLVDVCGSATSGQLLGILGDHQSVSILLQCLHGEKFNKTVRVTGNRLINGEPISELMAQSFSYLPSKDEFFGTLTVKEHLMYQALFSMDHSIKKADKKEYADSIIAEADLTHCKNAVIGIRGRLKGIALSDRKKLAIATQLLMPKRVILCENPTVYLSPPEAENAIDVLKKLALKRKWVVICTIEYSSSAAFALFDHVAVLASGCTLFMGNTTDALNFFSSIGYPCPDYHNPANHYLQVVHKKRRPGNQELNIIREKYDRSKYAQQYSLNNVKQQAVQNFPSIKNIIEADFIDKKYLPCKDELWLLFTRSYRVMVREPLLTSINLAQGLFSALMLAIVFSGYVIRADNLISQDQVTNINSVIFLMLVNMTYQNILPAVIVFSSDLPVLWKEHDDKLYRLSSFLFCRVVILFKALMIVPILFTVIVYWISGLRPNAGAFCICLGVMCLVTNISFAFGHMIACFCGTMSTAVAIAALISFPLMMLGGFFTRVRAMSRFFGYMRYLSWFWYSYEILMVNQWSEVHEIRCDFEDSRLCIRNGSDILQSMHFSKENVLTDVYILFGFFGILRLTSFIIISFRMKFQ